MRAVSAFVLFMASLAACGGEDAATTTTTATPPSCDAAMAQAAAPILLGAGIAGTATFSGEAPHPMVVMFSDGTPYVSCEGWPEEWNPDSIASIQLVAVIDPNTVVVETCQYTTGQITRSRVDLTITLHEAATGVEVASTTMQGNTPRQCGSQEYVSGHRTILGDPIPASEIFDWLISASTG